jgi:CHASE3 domain sensor protein/GAF domain-containing protein
MKFTLPERIKKQGMVSAIFFIVVLICINCGLFFYNRASLYESQEAKQEVEEVDKNLEFLWFLVQQGDLGIRGYLLLPGEKILAPYNSSIQDYEGYFDKLEGLLQKQKFNDPSLAAYRKQYVSKIEETILMKKLKDEGKDDEALAILQKDSGYTLWRVYTPFREKVMAFENSLREKAEKKYEESLYNTMVLQVFLFLLGFPVLSLVIFSLRRNDRQRKELFAQLSQSNQQYIFCENEGHAQELDDKKIIAEIIANLRKASDFIKNITKGNYEVQWEGFNDTNQHLNTNNLTGELIQMREQMKKVKEEDSKRLWANEGFARFADLLRIQNDLFEEKIHVFLSELIKYLQANQGAIFVATQEDNMQKVLKMRSCYAYGRQKYLKKTICPGEGLVGQAFLEKDVIFLTDIPSDYIEITSGLGNALPNSILIVPLVHNEQVVGILELASFHVFEDYQIHFIKKLMESLASTLISASDNDRTKLLLEESQQRAEEMRAQEEEMRQNMEELNATQEEMHRKEREYLTLIESLKSQKIV